MTLLWFYSRQKWGCLLGSTLSAYRTMLRPFPRAPNAILRVIIAWMWSVVFWGWRSKTSWRSWSPSWINLEWCKWKRAGRVQLLSTPISYPHHSLALLSKWWSNFKSMFKCSLSKKNKKQNNKNKNTCFSGYGAVNYRCKALGTRALHVIQDGSARQRESLHYSNSLFPQWYKSKIE